MHCHSASKVLGSANPQELQHLVRGNVSRSTRSMCSKLPSRLCNTDVHCCIQVDDDTGECTALWSFRQYHVPPVASPAHQSCMIWKEAFSTRFVCCSQSMAFTLHNHVTAVQFEQSPQTCSLSGSRKFSLVCSAFRFSSVPVHHVHRWRKVQEVFCLQFTS